MALRLELFIIYTFVFAVETLENNTQTLLHRFTRQSSSCGQLEYTCANGECIPSYNVCDGPKDCSDGSDETRKACRASRIRCPSLAFECAYGACIDKELRCNNKSDCADGSDEQGCSNSSTSCGNSKFQCSDGQCIYMYDICDGVRNCNDGSDETKDLCKHLVCPTSSFQCDYGACLERSVKCNDRIDCVDGSDELGCSSTTVTPVVPVVISPTTSTPSIGSCQLPEHPRHGVYVSSQCQFNDIRPACRNYPGTDVPHTWLLKYACNANYSLTSSDSEYSVCDNGVWKNPLDCIKLCSPLKSLSVDVRCVYGGREVSCDRPMKPNTTATAMCKQHYKQAYVPEYSSLLCLGNGEWSYPLFYCTPDCGVSVKSTTLTTLILHGSNTSYGEYPWLAALYLKNGSGKWEQQCAGTLITPHVVITAAHCLVTQEGKITPENVKVGLGKYYRDFYKNEKYSVISDVNEVVIPRYYSGGASFYALDIALLDLVVSVQVTGYIMPACVDWTSSFTIDPGSLGHVAGWGTTENSTSSDTILSTELTYVDTATCITKVRQIYKGFVTHDKFCAETIDGSQVNKGDSGGGLTIIRNGLHFLIGIVSTKILQETSFSLFTDIKNGEHRSWLEVERTRLKGLHRET